MRRNTSLSISSISSLSSPVSESPRENSIGKDRSFWLAQPQISTGLPSPLIKYEEESRRRPSLLERIKAKARLRQLVPAFAAIILFLCYYCPPVWSHSSQHNALSTNQDTTGTALPDHPSPFVVTDKHGRPRWTVHIPDSYSFPLRPEQYKDICAASDDLNRDFARKDSYYGNHGKSLWKQRKHYYAKDRAFLDVLEAKQMGLLPASTQTRINLVGYNDALSKQDKVCGKSLTFVMESGDAGFGNTLLALWLSYGLAKKEGRAFFINDSKWAYGKYTSYFPAPPMPNCAPPPPSQVLPCQHSAHHLVVSAATFPWTFGPSFQQQFEDTRKHGVNKQKQIYDMLRAGYEDLYQIIGEDASFAQRRIDELHKESEASDNPIIGMHIRRGDRHPFEYQFSHDYLPLERYTLAAQDLLHALINVSSSHPATSSPRLLLASDDPDIHVSTDLLATLPPQISVVRAQDRILLASKRTLTPSRPLREPGSAYTKHVDENSGWEGGFYAALFSSLGKPRGAPPSTDVPEQTMRLRELVGRAYLLDLHVLGSADAVVCGSSSAACRVLGVMMGWEKVVRGDWRNVDDGREWSWNGMC